VYTASHNRSVGLSVHIELLRGVVYGNPSSITYEYAYTSIHTMSYILIIYSSEITVDNRNYSHDLVVLIKFVDFNLAAKRLFGNFVLYSNCFDKALVWQTRTVNTRRTKYLSHHTIHAKEAKLSLG